jgi:DNA polymerase-3 subunit epsilon
MIDTIPNISLAYTRGKIMNEFHSETEQLDFLKKYGLISPTKTSLPPFQYYAPDSAIPVPCEITGYDQAFETWAILVINAAGTMIKIHSGYLLEMKTRGTSRQKGNRTVRKKDTMPSSYVVLDIETTGLSYTADKIIEIAAIKHSGGQTSEFQEYVYIADPVPAKITSLTGITNETLQDASPIDVVLPKFLSFIANHTLVGHNIKSFDLPFISRACSSLGLPPVKNKVIDTLPLARKKLPNLSNHKQTTLCSYFGIDTSHAHRALSDCHMCDQVYRSLTDDV